MKIAILNNLYPPAPRGGALKIAQTMEKKLSRKGHEVIVITTDPVKKSKESNIYYLKSFYLNLFRLPIFLRFFWQLYNLFNIRKYFQIKKILKKENCDLVITHNLQGLGQLTPYAIKKVDTTHFHVLHDVQLLHPSGLILVGEEEKSENLFARIYSYFNRRFLGSPDCVISPSRWILEKHQEKNFFPKSITKVIPNPVKPNRDYKNLEKFDVFTFIYAGQIEKHKGVEKLINTFTEINREWETEIRLLLVGSGSLFNQYKKNFQEFGKITFTGWKDPAETRELIARSHFLVLPSLCYENSPTVLYEALGVGTPVIASQLGGVPEIIETYGGLIFDPRNFKNLKTKLKKAWENYDYYNRQALETSQKIMELTPQKYTEKLEKIFKDIS